MTTKNVIKEDLRAEALYPMDKKLKEHPKELEKGGIS